MIYNSTIKTAEILFSNLKFYQKEDKSSVGENMTIEQKERIIEDLQSIIDDIKV